MTQTLPAARSLVPFHFAFGVGISAGLLTYNRHKISNLRTALKSSQPLEWSQTDEKRIKSLAGMTRWGKNESRDAAPDAWLAQGPNYQPMEIRIVPEAAGIVLVTL